ncbi:MAG: TlpA family protein disulfide reductase [Bacteroides sp.]|nr:TlpA family protein disulfide reductase [Bacteroides sp.]MCM1095835.1 TlpA family protein disulfide reductase [Terasakiella sp.]
MKNLQSCITAALLTLSIFTIYAEGSHAHNVIIAGKVTNMTAESAKVITAINCNPWSDDFSRHTVRIDSAGHFKTHVQIPYGHNFTIYYDHNFFCQYAEPGDSIFVTIDADNLKSAAHYSGSHARLNNEYGKAYADIYSKSFVQLPSEGISADEYLQNFKKIYSGLERTLTVYADSVGLCDEAEDLMRRSLLFSAANSAITYRDKSPEKTLQVFADSIFGLDNTGNLKEMMFPYHLSAYLNRLEDAVSPGSPLDMIDAIVRRHPKSSNRDVMMAIYLKNLEEEMAAPKISRHLFADANIYEIIYGLDKRQESLPDAQLPGGSIYELNDGEITVCDCSDLTRLLRNKFKGKIVYLDLWATWCGPCIASNKSLPEVADFFKDKDIVFVSVAIKSDIDRWKKLTAAHPANCKHYFINDEDHADMIMSTFGVDGFPAYRIIGKDSRILDTNPPRPNNPAIYNTLQNID